MLTGLSRHRNRYWLMGLYRDGPTCGLQVQGLVSCFGSVEGTWGVEVRSVAWSRA